MVFECLPCKKANRIPFSWEKLSRKRNHKKVCRSKPSKNKSKVKDGVSALAFGSSPSDFALLSSIFLQAGVKSAEKTLKSRDPRLQKKVRVKKQEETLGPMAGDQLFPGYCYVYCILVTPVTLATPVMAVTDVTPVTCPAQPQLRGPLPRPGLLPHDLWQEHHLSLPSQRSIIQVNQHGVCIHDSMLRHSSTHPLIHD